MSLETWPPGSSVKLKAGKKEKREETGEKKKKRRGELKKKVGTAGGTMCGRVTVAALERELHFHETNLDVKTEEKRKVVVEGGRGGRRTDRRGEGADEI